MPFLYLEPYKENSTFKNMYAIVMSTTKMGSEVLFEPHGHATATPAGAQELRNSEVHRFKVWARNMGRYPLFPRSGGVRSMGLYCNGIWYITGKYGFIKGPIPTLILQDLMVYGLHVQKPSYMRYLSGFDSQVKGPWFGLRAHGLVCREVKLIDFGFGSRILEGVKLRAKVGTFVSLGCRWNIHPVLFTLYNNIPVTTGIMLVTTAVSIFVVRGVYGS